MKAIITYRKVTLLLFFLLCLSAAMQCKAEYMKTDSIRRTNYTGSKKAIEYLPSPGFYNKKGKADTTSAQHALLAGMKHYSSKEYRLAVKDFDRAIALDPKYSIAYYDRGLSYLMMDDTLSSVTDLKKAVALNPNQKEAYLTLGFIHVITNDNSGAVSYFTQALDIDPDYKESYFDRGLARAEMGEYQTAIYDLKKALAIDSSYYRAQYFLSLCLLATGDTTAALRSYERCLALDSSNAVVYYQRAMIMKKAGEQETVLSDLDHAINIDSTEDIFFYERASIRSQMKDMEGAIQDYTHVLVKNPKDFKTYANRAFCFGSIGKSKEALADVNMALSIDTFYTVFAMRALIQEELGDYTAALADWNLAIKLNDTIASYYMQRGYCRSQLKNMSDAVCDLKYALKIAAPAEVKQIKIVLEEVRTSWYYKSSKNTDATDSASMATKQIWRALDKVQSHDYKAAIADYDRALQLEPDNATAYHLRGLAKFFAGMDAGGCSDFKKALGLGSGSAEEDVKHYCH